MSFEKGLIHAVADCQECDWTDHDYRTSQKSARRHHIKTGHRVHTETGYCGEYKND